MGIKALQTSQPRLKMTWVNSLKEKLQVDPGEICLIGKDSLCTIQIHGPDISDRHARIEKKFDHYMIRDLRSEAGLFINGVRVFEAPLNPGDQIQVGQHLIEVHGPKTSTTFDLRSKNQDWQLQLDSLPRFARTELPVLILGPSGTGKELLSKSIHDNSYRRSGPFVSVNCSALTETLIESELFGHIKGSFTGAIQDRKGAFESARGGTLFLDEVGDLPYTLQAKLLRALENKEIRPVGSDRTVKTDVRILAATHQNLPQMIEAKKFRQDLYFRLNVLKIAAPALNERMEDFDTILYQFAKEKRISFSFGAIQKLKEHSWPGNIRELKNAVARASALFSGSQVKDENVVQLIDRCENLSSQMLPTAIPLSPAPNVLKEIERQMIIRRLAANHGNQRQTAADLGMPKSTLHDRIRMYDINPKEFRVSE